MVKVDRFHSHSRVLLIVSLAADVKPIIKTSQLICRAIHLTGFYKMITLVVKGLFGTKYMAIYKQAMMLDYKIRAFRHISQPNWKSVKLGVN